MTISSSARKAGPFPGNGVTTEFPFTFKVFAKTDVQVTHTVVATGAQSVLVLDSDYSVTLNVDQDANPGGTITYPIIGPELPATETLVVLGDLAALQGNDIGNAGSFLPQVVEDVFDYLTILCQQLVEKFSRAISLPAGDTASPVLPTVSQRANKTLSFDDDGNAIAVATAADVQYAVDLALGYRNEAEGFRDGAVTAQVLAQAAESATETARDAALAAQRIFANAAAGDAGTSAGQYYYVVSASASETLELWLHNGAGGTDTGKRMPAGPLLAKQPSVIAAYDGTWNQRNLFNAATINAGKIQDAATGTLSANASFYVTDYIPVTPGKQIICTAGTPSGSANAFAYFDYNFVYVSGSAAELPAAVATTVPADAAYIRFTFANTVSTASLMICQGSSLPTTYAAWGEAPPSTYASARALDVAARPKRQNLYDADKRTTGHYIDASTGVSTVGATAFHTDYIPVNPGGQWTIYPASDSVVAPAGIAYYDRSLTYVSGAFGPFTSGQVFNVPARGSYVRVTANVSQASTLVILEGSQTPVSADYHNPAFVADTASAGQWSGKQFTVLGDSLSDPGVNGLFGLTTDWPSAVAGALGATIGLRAALSGRTMVDALKNSAGAALNAASFTDIDLAILFIGTNDYGTAATPIGTISDTTATASYYGYTKKAIEQILTWKPTIKFAICTLTPRQDVTAANASGHVLADYSTALRAVAERYRIPIIDLEKVCGLNSLNFATWTADNLHFNQAGQIACLQGPILGGLGSVWPTSF